MKLDFKLKILEQLETLETHGVTQIPLQVPSQEINQLPLLHKVGPLDPHVFLFLVFPSQAPSKPIRNHHCSLRPASEPLDPCL